MKQVQLTRNLPSSEFTSLKDVSESRLTSGILGVVNYTTECVAPTNASGYPALSVYMTDSAPDGFAEVWTTDEPVESGEHNGIAYAHDGEYLFLAGHVAPARAYTEETRARYTSALELMDGLGYRNCFRMWNFVNRINDYNAQGLEIYRDFCQGRAEAFERFQFGEAELPAATGIGSLGGGIAFYLLTCKSGRMTPVENPQQMSAYHYPKRYGPKAPKFARATHLGSSDPGRGRGQIYVAGTASIRGHETLFRGDVEQQCRLALDNITHVISAENLATYGIAEGYELSDLRNVKVYVRHIEDVEQVRLICQEVFSPTVDITFMNVDICRSDLLVEIEGIAL